MAMTSFRYEMLANWKLSYDEQSVKRFHYIKFLSMAFSKEKSRLEIEKNTPETRDETEN